MERGILYQRVQGFLSEAWYKMPTSTYPLLVVFKWETEALYFGEPFKSIVFRACISLLTFLINGAFLLLFDLLFYLDHVLEWQNGNYSNK